MGFASESPTDEAFRAHPVARTREPVEACEAVSRLYAPHRLDVLGRGAQLDARVNAVHLGAITAGFVRYGASVRLSSETMPHHLINIPLSGRTESWSGRDSVVGAVGQATVFVPDLPGRVRCSADCAQLSLRIKREPLESALAELIGRPLDGPIKFTTSMDVTTPASKTWLALVKLLEHECSRPASITSQPGAARHLERLLLSTAARK